MLALEYLGVLWRTMDLLNMLMMEMMVLLLANCARESLGCLSCLGPRRCSAARLPQSPQEHRDACQIQWPADQLYLPIGPDMAMQQCGTHPCNARMMIGTACERLIFLSGLL